ncbi:NAD-dependent epimerase/dehydratase family protein [Pseudomonas sp. Fl4BN1]|nr:NAD-dependent epimerase/dehydratase family protein [Pseudomonas sp. Fl4BN1]
MDNLHIGLLGARSSLGSSLISILTHSNLRVYAFTRQEVPNTDPLVKWMALPLSPVTHGSENIKNWICVAPIWVLADNLSTLKAFGMRRVVTLSSTSRFTKISSSAPEDQYIARRIEEAELKVRSWSEEHHIEWTILRPTLIYGDGRDKNIVEIARFIQRFSFFPIFGTAKGLRQPVHVHDVAWACVAAMNTPSATNKSYNISGSEVLPYREMVKRIFLHLNRPVRLLPIPLFFFKLSVILIRLLPRYRHWNSAMAKRMEIDMFFDHEDAMHDFGFKPRSFILSPNDLPPQDI